MSTYMDALSGIWRHRPKALAIVVLTVIRVYYGYQWLSSGLGKLSWFTDGTLNSAGLIGRMANNLAGPEVVRFDPLHINRFWAWFADTILVGMVPGLTDAMVVLAEIFLGLAMIVGLGVFWVAIGFMFLNVQFFAAGAFNNFGYVITNLVYWQFHKPAGAIGVDGFLRVRKGQSVTGGPREIDEGRPVTDRVLSVGKEPVV